MCLFLMLVVELVCLVCCMLDLHCIDYFACTYCEVVLIDVTSGFNYCLCLVSDVC